MSASRDSAPGVGGRALRESRQPRNESPSSRFSAPGKNAMTVEERVDGKKRETKEENVYLDGAPVQATVGRA